MWYESLRRVGWALLAFLTVGLAGASAQANPALTESFSAADGSRSYMDVGGVWNGTSEATASTGDTFTLTVDNNGAGTAHDLGLSVALPVGFLYVTNSVAGVSGITASQAGTTLTVSIPGSTTIASAGQLAISFGLTTATTVTTGSYTLTHTFAWADTPAGSQNTRQKLQTTVVQTGDSTIEIAPTDQTRAIGAVATWDVTVTNTGLGGLFDVEIDESALVASSSLTLSGMTQTAPVQPTATGSSPVLTLPYIAPGGQFVVQVTALVADCANINNAVTTNDRTMTTSGAAAAQVTLDLTVPLLTVTPPNVPLNYGSAVAVTVTVQNTGAGEARNVTFAADFAGQGLAVSNVTGGWSFSSGTFTYNANGGTILAGANADISFQVEQSNPCSSGSPGSVVWFSNYDNACGQTYTTPTELQGVTQSVDAPSVSLSCTGAERREVGQASQWTLTLSASNTQNIQTDPLVISDVLPAGITSVSIGSAPAGTVTNCAGSCGAGDLLTWSVPLAALNGGPLTLDINFATPGDPCLGGTFLTNTATVSAVDTAGCPVNEVDSSQTLLINNPGSNLAQTFNVAAAPDGYYETGTADLNNNMVRDAGEGEFLAFNAQFALPGGASGTFSNSTYEDDFGGLSPQALVSGTVFVTIGASTLAVPLGSITLGTGVGFSSPGITIDLGFMNGPTFANTDSVAGQSFTFQYMTTIGDAALPNPTHTYVQRSTLVLAGGTGGCAGSGATFTLGAFVDIARAAARVQVNLPTVIDVCETIPVTLTVSNQTVEHASSVQVTLDTTGDYEYVSPQTPVYGGQFTAGNITYTENGGSNPTFALAPTAIELATNGTITVMMRRKAQTTTATTGVSAIIDYDDHQTAPAGTRAFQASGSDQPLLVRVGDLQAAASPQLVNVIGDTAQWVVYATNGGSGSTYASVLRVTVPAGLTPNETACNAANPGFPVAIAGQLMTWSLGTIANGATEDITIVCDVAGSTCSIPSGSVDTDLEWGCGGALHQTTSLTEPDFVFPSGKISVLHAPSQSRAILCGTGKVEIVVRNAGLNYLKNVLVSEALDPSNTGVDIVPGTVEYKRNTDSGWTSGSNPTGAGAPYQFSSSEIPPLAELAPSAIAGGVNEVRIRFDVSTVELANSSPRSIALSATANIPCGNAATSTGETFALPLDAPEVDVVVTGRNVTINQLSYAGTVYGTIGDQIEWRVVLTNRGAVDAENVRLTSTLAASGAGSYTITGPGHLGGTSRSSGGTIDVPNLDGSAVTYLVTETLGGTCVDGQLSASATWGCVNNGATSPSNLSSPGDSTDAANIRMIPSFAGSGLTQSFTQLAGGRVRVTVMLSNRGGRAESIVITDNLPTGFVRDTTYSVPPPSGSSSITGVSVGGSATSPTFTLTGDLRNGESTSVQFEVLQSTGFDSTSNPFTNPETAGNGFDPTPPATGSNSVIVDHDSGCSTPHQDTDSASLDAATPDVDIAVTPGTLVVADGQQYSFDYTLTNNGDVGSVATALVLTTSLGAGWSASSVEITTAGIGGTPGVCPGGVCPASALGSLAAGQSAVVRVTATANDSGGLSMSAVVEGSLLQSDGGDTTNNYTLDAAQAQVIGFESSLALVSTSETETTGSNVAIGEDQTWRLFGRFFGGTPMTNIVVRNSLPTGLGYVDHAATGNNDVTINSTTLDGVAVSGATPVASGQLEFGVANTTSGTFEVDVLARARNVPGNTVDASLENNLGVSLVADYGGGVTPAFASDDAADGFGGSEPSLHAEATATVKLPDPTLVTVARNVTTNGTIGESIQAQAGDIVEYRTTITNDGNAPLFDISIVDDPVAATLLVVDGTSDGLDNDGDALVDGSDAGGEGVYVAGSGGTVTFAEASTQMTLGSSLARLDPGQTVTLLYRVTLDSAVVPDQSLLDAVALSASTLSGANGGQSADLGTPGSASGERLFSDTESATTEVVMIMLTKAIDDTSVSDSTGSNVFIGEQVRFELAIVLPAGQVPAFVVEDQLPAGLSLLETPAVSIGSAISSSAQPSITPNSLPAGGNPLTIEWDFGTRNVAASVAANRTVTIQYVAQVENVAGNVGTGGSPTQLINSASYSFTGSSPNTSTITLAVAETTVTVSQMAVPATVVDAGQVVTYTVQVDNTGNHAAYDLDWRTTLPTGMTYVANSTSGATGPAITEPSLAGSTLTWGRSQVGAQDIDLTAGQSMQWSYQVLIGDGVEPDQVLTNQLVVDWTSLDGDPGPNLGTAVAAAGGSRGERTGSGAAANGNASTGSEPTTVANEFSTDSTAVTGDTLSRSGFRIGDLVTLTTQVSLQEGTVDSFRIVETLPAGLSFFDAQAITPASGSQGFTFTQPTGPNLPSAGATGALTFNLGTVVNAGDNAAGNDSLTLVYRARIEDDVVLGVTPTTQSINTQAQVLYQDGTGNAESTGTQAGTIVVKQPQLAAVSALRTAMASGASETVGYRLTITNSGGAPAYNLQIADVLPVGMRNTAPTLVAANIGATAVNIGALGYTPGTGQLGWSLPDGIVLGAGAALVVDYNATVDATIGGGLSLGNTPSVAGYFSKPSADPVERRQYAASNASSQVVGTPAPNDMQKVADVSSLAVGEVVTFTLTVPATPIDATLYDVNFTDAVDARLRVTGVSDNSAALATTTSSSTSGNGIDVTFAAVPPNMQAVLTVTAVVEDQVGTTTATSIPNQANYTWAKASSGSTQSAILSGSVSITIDEPDLAVAKTFKSQTLANPNQGLQAGDTVTYTITVTNSGDGAAHDFVLRDVSDDELVNPIVTANPDNPGAVATSTPSGSDTVHTWNTVAGPIAAGGGTYQFDITFTIANTVQPFQNMDNDAEVDWYSTSGPNSDRRGPGTGYTSSTPTTVSVTAGSVSMTKADLGGGNYTIGDEITYRLAVTIVQGQVVDLHVIDDLPNGLEFRSATLTSTDLQQSGGGAVAVLSGPSQGDEGILDWDLGDLSSTGANPSLQLDIVARMLDQPSNSSSSILTNAARSTIEFPPGSGNTATINAQADPQLTVVEPELVLALDAPASVVLGTPAAVQARLRNDGTSNAWQPTLVVELPTAMRATDPSTLPLAVGIADGRSLTLVTGTDYSIAWDANTGRLALQLLSAAAYLAPGETMTVNFEAALNSDASDGATQSLLSTVTSFGSQDASAGVPDLSREYPTTFGAGTLNTPNAAFGDDSSDGADTVSAVPILVMTKAVDQPAADPGTALHYTISITNTGSADGTDAVLRDDLADAFAAGTLRNVVVTPAGGVGTSDPNGGANGTGAVVISDLTIPSSNSVVVAFDVDLKAVLPNGSTVANQAGLTLPVFPEPLVSDSTRVEDDDGIESGNDPGDANDDDATDVLIGSMPVLAIDKTVSDLNGDGLEPGDELEWTLTLRNTGNEVSEQTVLTDAVPANTTYVAGSTIVNGTPVADPPGGGGPLPAGLEVASPGAANGVVNVSEPVVVTFRVQVVANAANGSLVTNQASVEGRGEGTATLASALSDDPTTQTPGDATAIVVGSGPSLRITKTAFDTNGSPLLSADTVRYAILIENVGNESLEQVVLQDVVPSDLAFTAGSITYDPDGAGPTPPAVLSDSLDGDVGDFGVTTALAVTVQVGSLVPGASVSVQFDATVNASLAAGTLVSNQAQVQSQQLPPQLSDADGDSTNGAQPTNIVVGNVASLTATKSVVDLDGEAVKAGDHLRFVIRLHNPGTQDANNVVLTDLLPLTVGTYVAGSTQLDGISVADGGGGDSALLTGLAIGTIGAGEDRTITVEMLVATGATEGQVVQNEASFVADGPITGSSNVAEVVVGGSPGSATVRGNTWLDIDHDRVRGVSELPQTGWTVEVSRNGLLVATAVSGTDGSYELAGLLPGSGYEIRFRHPETNVVYGGAISSAPGATTAAGTIQNLNLPSGSLTLEQSLPVDPSGVIYNAVTRAAVPGVTVTLVGPAGFDPLVHLLPGQAVQATDATGFYRFDLTPGSPLGVYTLQPVPPAGFLPTVPSQIVPPLAGPLDPTGLADPLLVAPQTGPPQTGESTDYYLSFDLAPGDPNVVNNHVALDPVLEGAIVVTKTTPKTDVVRGELVPYEVTMRNTVSALLPNLDLIDVVPPGFKYVSGSASLDGVPTAPVVQGRTLTWSGLSLAALQERRVQLLLVVGVGSDVGNYVNRAHVLEPSSSIVVSNVANAVVRVVPDPLFDGSDVIGKVFDDANANGVQDKSEPGMPGVRLITARGLVVLTDAFGRYHITDPLIVSRSRGANFIIKLDPRSLPTGYRMTTENPRVIRLTRGKISKANFGVARMRVVRIEFSGEAFADDQGLELQEGLAPRLEAVIRKLEETPSLLRLAYVQVREQRSLVKRRLDHTTACIQKSWASRGDRPTLVVEHEIVRASVLPPERPGAPTGETVSRPNGAEHDMAGRIEILPLTTSLQPDPDRSGLDSHRIASSGISLRVRRLNVAVAPTLGVRAVADTEANLRFEAVSSFPALVASGEVVIKRAVSGEEVARLPLGPLWQASWRMPNETSNEDLTYAVRLVLHDGTVVESDTGSLTIRGQQPLDISTAPPTLIRLPDGEATTALSIYGEGADDHRIWIDGVAVVVAADGSFAHDLLMPAGRHELRVTMQGPHGQRRTVARTVRVAQGYRVEPSEQGKVRHRSAVRVETPTQNTERANAPRTVVVPPFRVSIDGEPTGQGSRNAADAERATDMSLADAHIQVSFDGLRQQRRLNVSTWPEVAVRGEPVVFDTYSNYDNWITRAEVRIHAPGSDAAREPLVVLPLDQDGRASWQATAGFGDRVDYVLRVYNREGQFDETRARPLTIASESRPVEDQEQALLLRQRLYGSSQLAKTGIVLGGGTVKVNGTQVPAGYRVLVNGQLVPVDPNGRFVTDRILSPGTHDVVVDLVGPDARTVRFERPIVIPDNDWFYVAMADLTMAAHDTDGPGAELLAETSGRDDVFLDGRVALYLKGKIKGDWLITAMLDTGEEGVENLLKNIDGKDPRQLLRRLDPDRYYYVYGDDSTTQWDAATMGKFYVRIERGTTHVLWGNFQTQILDTEFGQLDRALYGAKLHWQTEAQNERGKPRVQVDAYAAEPETIQSREQFRGTGGSLYYLRNQDVTIGSERLRVEVRDRDSGLVLETKELRPFEDYDFNYIQGRILLTEPLGSVAGDGYTVRNASLAGQPVYLVVRYEYRPTLGTLNNMSVGGRISGALGEWAEFGLTGGRDEQIGIDQELLAADLTLRASDRSWFKLEAAQSDGPGLGERFSVDGGFAFGNVPRNATPSEPARALRFETAFDLRDAFGEDFLVDGTAYYEQRDSGFSAPGRQTLADTYQWGVRMGAELSDDTRLDIKWDRRRMDFGSNTDAGHVDLRHDLGKNWSLQAGLAFEDNQNDLGSPLTFQQGKRLDGALQLTYESDNDWEAYVFGQATLDRDASRQDMSRGGVGGSVQLSDRLTVGGELSGGATGLGTKANLKWKVDERTDTYLTYGLGTDSTAIGIGQRAGTLTSGAKHRYSDAIQLYGEERYRHGDGPEGLTHAYGVDFTPDDRWTIGASIEDGQLIDPLGGEIERTSVSLSGGYRHGGVRYGGAVELRDESFSGSDRETWLVRNNLGVKLSDDWRGLAKANFSFSNGSGGQFFDGDFVEASTGLAYRPVANDRWNWLLTYTYLADLPSAGQVTRAGGTFDLEQRSHVFAYDVTWDALDWMSVGGKYALRHGELRMSRTGQGDWFDSTTQLAILRCDWHAVDEWDVHLEGRWHDIDASQDERIGALLGVYRHMSKNVRFGLGYNFTDFSDRITDLRYDSQGFFVNLTAKF